MIKSHQRKRKKKENHVNRTEFLTSTTVSHIANPATSLPNSLTRAPVSPTILTSVSATAEPVFLNKFNPYRCSPNEVKIGMVVALAFEEGFLWCNYQRTIHHQYN